MPGTVRIVAATCWDRRSSVCRSGPKIFTEFSPFTPEAASSTLSSMYCEKLNSTPGKRDSSCASSWDDSASLVTPAGQSPAGFKGTKNSALNGPVASVPSSGRPCWDTVVCTSGKLPMTRRISLT